MAPEHEDVVTVLSEPAAAVDVAELAAPPAFLDLAVFPVRDPLPARPLCSLGCTEVLVTASRCSGSLSAACNRSNTLLKPCLTGDQVCGIQAVAMVHVPCRYNKILQKNFMSFAILNLFAFIFSRSV